jgi:hypothetical protein
MELQLALSLTWLPSNKELFSSLANGSNYPTLLGMTSPSGSSRWTHEQLGPHNQRAREQHFFFLRCLHAKWVIVG